MRFHANQTEKVLERGTLISLLHEMEVQRFFGDLPWERRQTGGLWKIPPTRAVELVWN